MPSITTKEKEEMRGNETREESKINENG